MYRLLSLAVVLSLSSEANAQLQAKPQTPTPTPLIREAFMPKGEVLLSYPMEATLNGKPIWLWKYHHRKVNDLVVTNARGEKLTDEEIRKVLAKPTMVLVSADGQPIHKYYLTVFKPETLVIIDKTPKRETPNREPVKLKTKDVDSPQRETPKENVAVEARAQQEFQIAVHIVEMKPIKGLTKKATNSEDHLHIKPALLVTPADVTAVRKRRLRGPTIGTKKKGFKHYPRVVVDLQLTEEAKLRLKRAVSKARSATARTPLIATVVDDHYDGAWTKFVLDDPTSLVYWSKFGCRISCTGDEEKADRLVKHFSQTKTNK